MKGLIVLQNYSKTQQFQSKFLFFISFLILYDYLELSHQYSLRKIGVSFNSSYSSSVPYVMYCANILLYGGPTEANSFS